MKHVSILLIAASLLGCTNIGQSEGPTPLMKVEEQVKNATIYEVNIRQYTPEGTLSAFRKHLPRLKKIGVKILWIMPVQPIGEKNRKGPLGSYYSISDYTAVNPSFGTLKDFKAMVEEAHAMDMLVILDWVANHTSFDHAWTQQAGFHTTRNGEIIHPEGTDWTDVADLNYENPEMRQAMIDDMQWWVQEADIDGFRCDVAAMVPSDFWHAAVDSLNLLKPMFMLAEANEPELHNYFHMTYAWDLHHQMNELARGQIDVPIFREAVDRELNKYPAYAMRMMFITNHDENSWNGTINERLGAEAHPAFAVLYFTIGGMPLIYSGQEAGLSKRLRFFEKDTISWDNLGLQDFYAQLVSLKKDRPALQHGPEGGILKWLPTNQDRLMAYQRINGSDTVRVVLNFSDDTLSVTGEAANWILYDYFSQQTIHLSKEKIPAYGYFVGIKK